MGYFTMQPTWGVNTAAFQGGTGLGQGCVMLSILGHRHRAGSVQPPGKIRADGTPVELPTCDRSFGLLLGFARLPLTG